MKTQSKDWGKKIGKTNDFKVLGEIKPKGGPNRILKIV
jgi:hypothetical protein